MASSIVVMGSEGRGLGVVAAVVVVVGGGGGGVGVVAAVVVVVGGGGGGVGVVAAVVVVAANWVSISAWPCTLSPVEHRTMWYCGPHGQRERKQ